MTSFENLSEAVVLARSKSAVFHKVDLHIHSDESHDFPKLGDKLHCATELGDIDKSPRSEDFLDAAAQVQDLTLIAITDHNKCRRSVDIAQLSRKKKGIVVLPGMEITLQVTIFPDSLIHVLAVFPQDCSSEDIERTLANSRLPKYDQRTKESVANVNVDELISNVDEAGGICIAGHVNSSKGIRSFFRESNVELLKRTMRVRELERKKKTDGLRTGEDGELESLRGQIRRTEDEIQNQYLEFLSTYHFHAVEVQKSQDSQFYSGVHTDMLGLRPIACLLGSDAHTLQDIGLKGSTSYIKMTSPGIRDLKRALLDPDARIRYEDTVPHPRIPRIFAIRFSDGFFRDTCVGFSDNLTCLIGGRGSGKSAVLEALRFVFQKDIEHLHRDKRKDIEDRKNHTLGDAPVEVMFSDAQGQTLVLRRAQGEEKTACYQVDGSQQDQIDVSIASNIDVKIFGWGEIEELARNKREQLKLIDGFIVEAPRLRNEIKDALQELSANTGRIVVLASEIEGLLPRISQLPEKEQQLARLNTEELNSLFSEFDKNEAGQSALEVLQQEILKLQQRFYAEDERPIELTPVATRAIEAALGNISDYAWVGDFQQSFNTQIQELQKSYEALLEEFGHVMELVNQRVTLLGEDKTAIEDKLTRAAEMAEAEDGHSNVAGLITRRKQLTREVSDLRAIENSIQERQTALEQLMLRRSDFLIPELGRRRKELTEIRQAKIREINQRLAQLSNAASITIDVMHQEEREDFRFALGAPDPNAPDGILKGLNQWYKVKDYAGQFAKKCSPHSFVKAVLDLEAYMNLSISITTDDGSKKTVISEQQAKQVADFLSPYPEPEKPYFDAQKLRILLELEHIDTEDLPLISLDGKHIEQLSPGQRCSALIPIILLESNSPLIIDQPEDNLDNKLVFSLVVSILRNLKERRQIIVATHNPNIPVSGDAEQIVVFESSSRECCESIAQGSIDDPTIVEHIKAIMEGSAEAFRIRAEKYGYRLGPIP